MNRYLSTAALIAAGALALSGAVRPAQATTVATIVGAYDKNVYDTPELDFFNTSGGTFINAKMVLLGYQGLNNGVTQTVNVGTMATGETDLDWGFLPGFANYPTSGPPGSLTTYDYDDSWGNTPAGYTNPACIVTTSLCSDVGNFKVTFTATISGGTFNGDPVFSVFSPTTNFTGGFVGWEGLNQAGVSESTFDQHSGTFSGTMAIIQIGTPPPIPEPSTWTMMLVGFGGLGFASYRVRKGAKAAVAA
jgi:PEP-CTERM motif